MRVSLLLISLAVAPLSFAAAPPPPADQSAATHPMEALALTSIQGEPFDLAQLAGKAVLFVNVASKCGYTKQYDGLQALYEAKKDEGLVIVGVPCNQFGGQEPGTPEEIVTFCRMNYGVTFPLLEKQDVNGADRSALYQWLIGSEAGGGKNVGWNFEKFLVSPDGQVTQRFGSRVTPDDAALVGAIDAVLPK